jgi:hypothetical protein
VKSIGNYLNGRRSWLIFLLLGLVFFIASALLWPAREVPRKPVVIMNQPYVIAPAKVPLLDRVMPASKTWAPLWQLRYVIFGRNKSVNIEGTIIDLTGSKPLSVIDLLPERPEFEGSNGLRVWRLNEVELKGVRNRLKEAPEDHILASPRIITGDGTQAGLFSGQPIRMDGKVQQVGCSMNLLPRIRGSTTDLSAIVVYSEAVTNQTSLSLDVPSPGSVSIQTNFSFGGRFQLPKESVGILVLYSAPGSSKQKEIGLLLSCKVLEGKK